MFSIDTKKISIKLFNQRIPLTYLLFNFMYKKIFLNNKFDNSELIKFHNSGFIKTEINFKDIIDEYEPNFFIEDNKDQSKKSSNIKIKDEYKKAFLSKIENKLQPLIKKLENYLKCDVFISQVKMTRNHYHEDKYNLNISHYSNHFHQDSYLMNYMKIFVNLMDINETDGPLEIIHKENKKQFLKSFKYKDMYNYNLFGNKKLIYKNTGKKGESFLFSSTQVFHRAGIPENFRDNMMIILLAIPAKSINKEDLDTEKIFEDNSKFIFRFSKPFGILNIIKILNIFFKYRFMKNFRWAK